MRPYQVRTKNSRGKPVSGWRTVYANSEREAAVVDAQPQWIQNAAPKKGALHRQLGYPLDQKIPFPVLQRIKYMPIGGHIHGHTVTPLMKKRANFAMNVRK